jgi:putative drug exporter of the RND superfamily
MHLLGRRNWWLPRSIQRRLPQLYVEGRPERYLPAPDDPLADEWDRDRVGAPA